MRTFGELYSFAGVAHFYGLGDACKRWVLSHLLDNVVVVVVVGPLFHSCHDTTI